MRLSEYRKGIAAVIGLLTLAISQGLIVGTAAKWVAIAIAAVTGYGVIRVPNDQPRDSSGRFKGKDN